MVSLADSLVASSSRPLALKMRADLTARRQRYQGRTYWVVKEPVGLRYFRFQEEEFAVLNMIKDGASLDDIKQRFEKDFAPHKITFQDLQHFIGTLHRSGLVVSDAPGQGKQLRKRRDERFRKELLSKLSNVLAIRFKGIDPERFLTRSFPFVRWYFSRTTLIVLLIAGACALLLLGVQFDEFRQRLPAFQTFFGPKNWLLLGVTLGVTKILHEFGHGYLCKKFGGECHEMGVMFLVLTPCLYCNVSDSWMLPNKWHRAAIGAGGIFVELTLATIATYVWWFTEPGMLNHLSLRVMFICSVSTILFNGNPLLRFDGYYILADVMEIPNMRQKASKILQNKLAELCLGLEMPEDPFLPQGNQVFFMLYTMAAVIYRWFIFFSILFFLNKIFEPYGLKIIGQVIALMGLFGLIVQPLWQGGKFFNVPGRMDQVKWPRVYITSAIVAAIIAGIGLVPLPRNVKCSLLIQPRDAKPVYVHVPGIVEKVLKRPGDAVSAGDVIMELRNPDLRLEIERLKAEVELYEARIESIRLIEFRDPTSGDQLQEAEARLKTKQQELAEKQSDLDRLSLTAPIDGVVLPSQLRPAKAVPQGQLPQWTGSPFDAKNQGVLLQVANEAPVCQIGSPGRLKADLAVDQADIEFVKKGDPVKIRLDALTWMTFEGQINEISRERLRIAPRPLANQAGGDLATRPDASGMEVPLSTTFPATVHLDDTEGLIEIGFRGKAKIRAGYQTIFGRAYRYVARTFHFYM